MERRLDGGASPRRGVLARLGLAAATFAACLAGLTGVASAATIHASPSGATSSCGSAATPCDLPTAVSQANDGDTVLAAPGTYTLSSPLAIQKSITLQGAQAGNDARTRSVPSAQESTVTGAVGGNQGLIQLEANDIVIDGFTVSGATGGPGIAVIPGDATGGVVAGYQIINNIVDNNVFGIYANASPAMGPIPASLIQHNLIENNNQTGASGGNGIYADQGTQDLTVNQNTFTGDTNGDVFAGAYNSPVGPQRNIAVTDNTFNNEASFDVFGINDSSFTGNTFTGGANTLAAIQLDDAHNVQVADNTVTGLNEGAFEFFDVNYNAGTANPPDNPGPSTDVSITGNNVSGTGSKPGTSYSGETGGAIQLQESPTASDGLSQPYSGTLTIADNRISGNAAGVVNQDPTASDATIDATDNFWGCNAGPNATGCDKTTGANITATPYLVLTAGPGADEIPTGGHTTSVQATIDQDSAGNAVGGTFPSLPVSFATTLGSLSPANASTSPDGNAQSKLTSGTTPGTATVTAKLDNATATTQVVFSSGVGGGNIAGNQGGSAKVKILSGKSHVSSNGVSLVRVKCVASSGNRCVGTLTLRRGRTTLATGSYNVARGKTATVRLHLSKGERSLVADHKHGLRTVGSARTAQPGGIPSDVTRHVKLRV